MEKTIIGNFGGLSIVVDDAGDTKRLMIGNLVVATTDENGVYFTPLMSLLNVDGITHSMIEKFSAEEKRIALGGK